jgi:hypothetical protein
VVIVGVGPLRGGIAVYDCDAGWKIKLDLTSVLSLLDIRVMVNEVRSRESERTIRRSPDHEEVLSP